MRLFANTVIAGFLAIGILGCADKRVETRQQVVQQLALRKAGAEKSLKLYHQAMAAYEAKEMGKARELLLEAVQADDRNAYAYVALGVVESQRDSLFDAACDFRKASQLEPDRYEPYYNMGIVLEMAGKYQQAVDAYESALGLAPNQLEIMENLARCCVRGNIHVDRAKTLIEKSLASEERPEWKNWLEHQAWRLKEDQK